MTGYTEADLGLLQRVRWGSLYQTFMAVSR